MENRKYPIIDIAGINFFVDAASSQLIDTNNPQNKISVLEMLTLDDHHEFLFDKQNRNIKEGAWDESEGSEALTYVWIRRIEALDPVGMRSHESTKQIEKALKDLPVVDISGTKFYWSRADTAFLEVDNIWNKIYKNDITAKDSVQGFYFDTKCHHVPFPHELDAFQNKSQLPAHILFIPIAGVLQQLKEKNELVNTAHKRSSKKKISNKKANRL